MHAHVYKQHLTMTTESFSVQYKLVSSTFKLLPFYQREIVLYILLAMISNILLSNL